MALDKKQIALTVGGIMAGLTLTYLLYRLEQQNKASNDASKSAITQSELANQQAQIASLPAINVPTISSSPSVTDTSNQSHSPAIDPNLEAILANVLSQDNSSVTSQSSPIASITALPFPTVSQIPTVVIPSINDFSKSSPVASSVALPISVSSTSPFSNVVNQREYSNSFGANRYRTNLAKGASLDSGS